MDEAEEHSVIARLEEGHIVNYAGRRLSTSRGMDEIVFCFRSWESVGKRDRQRIAVTRRGDGPQAGNNI